MGSEWKKVPLNEIYDFRSGLSKPRSEFGYGYGFLTFKDVLDNYFVPKNLTALVNSNEREREACSITKGDVFLTRTSETQDDLGMSCVALKDYEGATFNGFTKRLRPKIDTDVVPEYCAYYFRSPQFRRAVTAMSTLSTRASLNNDMLDRLEIVLPSVTEQKAIGWILKSLDDKIELNRRMNETLEKMAQALFQSWFVDFDPVIDKALAAGHPIPAELEEKAERRQALGDSRKPLPAHIADLFPDRFVDSALEPIPEGWEVGTLSSIIEIIGGGTPRTANEEYWDGDIPWFSVVDAPQTSDLWVLDTQKHVTQSGIDNSSCKILPERTTIISARGTVGKCALVGRPMGMNQSCYGICPKNGDHNLFINYIVRNQISHLQRSGHGSVFNTITRDTFESIKIVNSGPTIQALFDRTIESAVLRILEVVSKPFNQ